MNSLNSRIETMSQVLENWLTNDNEYLQRAVDQTVDEGYFSASDVQFALNSLKKSLSREAIENWVKNNLSEDHDASGQNVLCLHAGNLPLVGFQDALATLLSGARYTGKISRKDPYLLPTFLNEAKKTDIWRDPTVQWSHRLDDFEDMQNDAILFAGSDQSIPGVKHVLNKCNLVQRDTRFLIRTAHFSLAYFDEDTSRNIDDLTEAMCRYGGQGCRSVAVVVSPFSLADVSDALTQSVSSFLAKNSFHQKADSRLRQQSAYNKAVGHSQIRVDNFLLQEGGLELEQDLIYFWIQGNETKAADLAQKFGDQLQSIYVTNENKSIPGFEERTELLSQAQQPPINWKPDGIDTLQWLAETKENGE